jgi:hypothetical protein
MVTGFTIFTYIFNTGLDISTLTDGNYGRVQGGVSVLSHSLGGHTARSREANARDYSLCFLYRWLFPAHRTSAA